MKVEEAVVHGRIGPVKSEYSDDELPLDPSFATVLLDWKRFGNRGNSGVVFRTMSPGSAITLRRSSRTGSGGRGGVW
ncbi:hypothetical protein [Occallatibacter riparius]|uniref:Uncharacterized protein n=1 Tax=Occallatibacter riparius TaxID=1002689 RepID=A0A9J7BT69_9BACT|nr:hypothetical protein [Occallatibacter riparius]UWZ85823.1 hypothetical protein MOP44_07715 [Occallatibacter riparius]